MRKYLKSIIRLASYFLGSIAIFWTIIEISQWQKIDWFIPSLFVKYGVFAWIIIPLAISIILLVITNKILKQDESTPIIIDSFQVNVQNSLPVMHDSHPIKVDKDNFLTTIKITAGDYRDFLWKSRKVRITVTEIVKETFNFHSIGKKESYGAVIYIDTGGGIVYGGEESKYVEVNKYLVPKKLFQDQEPCSIYSFYITEDYFSFFRVFIEHINPNAGQVTLSIFFTKSHEINVA